MERYGVEYTTQNREILLKGIRTRTKSKIIKHWKTSEKLICTASYEIKTVDYLNSNRINYDWQPKFFIMPDKRRYLPDLYLIDEDKWIEIKGHFWGDAEEKWIWFHKSNPNCGRGGGRQR